MTVRTLLVFSFGALCLAIALSAGAAFTPVTPLGDQQRWEPRDDYDFVPYAATNGRLTAVAWATQDRVCRVVVIGEDGTPVNPHGTVLPICDKPVSVMWDGTEFKVAIAYGIPAQLPFWSLSRTRIYGVTVGGTIEDPTGIDIEENVAAIATNGREFLACEATHRICSFVGFDGHVTLPPISVPFDKPAIHVDGDDFIVSGFVSPTGKPEDSEFTTLRVNRSGMSRSGFRDIGGQPPPVIYPAAGKRLAVWRSAGFGRPVILFAFLDDSGQPLSRPAELDVLPLCCSNRRASDDPPSVTYDGEAFVVVWSANESGELRAARISSTGAIIEHPFVIDKAEGGLLPARNPAVAMTTAGLRLVWTSVDASGTNRNVYRQAWSAAGLTSASTMLLATVLPPQFRLRISGGTASALAVWWEGTHTLSLHAAAISPGGVASEDVTIVTLPTTLWRADVALSPFLEVAAGPDGFLVAWTESPRNRVARFDRNGNLVPGSITTVASGMSAQTLIWDGSQYIIAGTNSQYQLALLRIDAGGTPIDGQPQLFLAPLVPIDAERAEVNVQPGERGTVVTWVESALTPPGNFRACGGRLNASPSTALLPQCYSLPDGGIVKSRSSGDDVVMFGRDKEDHCLWARRFPFDSAEATATRLYCDEAGRGLDYNVRWYDGQWLVIDRVYQRLFRFDRHFQAAYPIQGWTPWPVSSFSPAFGGYILAGEQFVGDAGGVYRAFFQLDVTRRRRSAGQ